MRISASTALQGIDGQQPRSQFVVACTCLMLVNAISRRRR
jgi:hypothetical protein